MNPLPVKKHELVSLGMDIQKSRFEAWQLLREFNRHFAAMTPGMPVCLPTVAGYLKTMSCAAGFEIHNRRVVFAICELHKSSPSIQSLPFYWDSP